MKKVQIITVFMRVIRGLATAILVLGPVLLVPAIAEDAKILLRHVQDGTAHFIATVREEGLTQGLAALWPPPGEGHPPPTADAAPVALATPEPEQQQPPSGVATYSTQGEAVREPKDAQEQLTLVPPSPVLAIPPERSVPAGEAHETASNGTEPGKEAAPALVPPAPVPASPKETNKDTSKERAAPETVAAVGTQAKPEPSVAPAVVPQATTSAPAKETPGGKKDAKPPLPAKQLFAAAKSPAPLAARSIGFYAKGCLAGAKALPVDGPAWQVMRLSRNRFYGHPDLISLVERLAKEVKSNNEWPGLLVGDISQARGGPMLTGHASHQVGLDADIWLTPMPDRRLSEKERENLSATSMLAADDISVNPKVWGDGQVKLIKRAASYKAVERILVHPAIKKALCDATAGQTDRAWLHKVRPYFGHYYHFHIRIGCPSGSANCTAQPPVPGDDGCGDEIKDWIKRVTPKPPAQEAKPTVPAKPVPKKPEITLADLPAECRAVLASGGNVPPTEAVMVDTSKDAGPEATPASDTDAPTTTAKAQ